MKYLPDLLTLRRSSAHLSVNSSVMSKFDIYVKVSILINYNSTTTIIPCMTHLPDLLTWQVCWPNDLDLYFALHWLWHNLRWRSRGSQFDIYVKVSILINYKTKQPSNLAWNISLTSRLCDIGARFSIRLSVHPSVCPSVNSSVMSVRHLCQS